MSIVNKSLSINFYRDRALVAPIMEELVVERLQELTKQMYSNFNLNDLLSTDTDNQISNIMNLANPENWSLKCPLKKLFLANQIEKKLNLTPISSCEMTSNNIMSLLENLKKNWPDCLNTPLNFLPLLTTPKEEYSRKYENFTTQEDTLNNSDMNEISLSIAHHTNKDSGISSLSEYSLKCNDAVAFEQNCFKFIELFVVQQQITALREYQNLKNKHLPSTSLVSLNKCVKNWVCEKDSVSVSHQDVSTQTHSESISNAIVPEYSNSKFYGNEPVKIIDRINQPNILGQIVNFNQYLVNLEDKVQAMTQLLFIMCGKDAFEVLQNLKKLSPSPKNCSLLRIAGIMSFLVRCAYANLQKFVETTQQNIRVELPVDTSDLQENGLNKSSLNWHIQLNHIFFEVPSESESLAAELQRCLITTQAADDLVLDLGNRAFGNHKMQKEIKILELLDPLRLYLYELFKVVLECFALVRLVDEYGNTNAADNEDANEDLKQAIQGGTSIKDLKNIKISLEQSHIQKLDIGEAPKMTLTLLLKLSYDEDYRNIICEFGGLRALTSFIIFDYFLNEHSINVTTLFQRILLTIGDAFKAYPNGNNLLANIVFCRKLCCIILTNLTFSDQNARGFLCSQPYFLQALIYLLRSPDLSLVQISATLLRNLSWNPKDILVKVALSNPRLNILATTLNKLKDLFNDFVDPKTDGGGVLDADLEKLLYVERVIKDICAIVWNLTSQPLLINEVINVWTSFVEVIQAGFAYISPSSNLDVLERIVGILKNLSEVFATLKSELMPPIYPLVFDTLLQHLRYSTSLTMVSNACSIIRNMTTGDGYSAIRCRSIIMNTEGCYQMLSRLSWSIHVPIRRGANGILQNLHKYTTQKKCGTARCITPKGCITTCENMPAPINGETEEPRQSNPGLGNNISMKLNEKYILSASTGNLTPMMFSRHSSMSQLSDFSERCSKTTDREVLYKSDVESVPTDRIGSDLSNHESLIPSSCPSPTHSLDPTQPDNEDKRVLNDRSTIRDNANNSQHEMHCGRYTEVVDASSCANYIEQNPDDTAHVYATENTPFLFSSRYSSLSLLEDPSCDMEEIPNNFETVNTLAAVEGDDPNPDPAVNESPANFVGEDEECYEDEYDEGEEDIINACIQSVFPSGKNVFDTQIIIPASVVEKGINTMFQQTLKTHKALSDGQFFQGISNDSHQPGSSKHLIKNIHKFNDKSLDKSNVCRSHPIVPNFCPPNLTKFHSRTISFSDVKGFPQIEGIMSASSESQLYKLFDTKHDNLLSKRHKSELLTPAPCLQFISSIGFEHGILHNIKPGSIKTFEVYPAQTIPPISCSTDNYLNINSDAYYDRTTFQKPQCITFGPDPSFDNGGDNLQIFATEGTPFYLSKTHSFEQLLSHLSTHSLVNATSYDHMAHTGIMGNNTNVDKDEECEEPEDMIKTYATEGTPYHASRSPSMEYDELLESNNTNYCFRDTQDILYSLDCDEEIKVFNLENTPIEFSKKTSLSELIFSSENDILISQQVKNSNCSEVKEIFRMVTTLKNNQAQQFSNIAETSGFNEDEFILAPPPVTSSKSYSKTESIIFKTSTMKGSQEGLINTIAECYDISDSPRIYNVEGTPLVYSRQDSYSNLLSPVIGSLGMLSCNASSPIQSRNISQESLTMEPSPMDEALLKQCIHSALPKSREAGKKSPHSDASCDTILRFETSETHSFISNFNNIANFNSQNLNLIYTDARDLSYNNFGSSSNLFSSPPPEHISGFCKSDNANPLNKHLTLTKIVFKDKEFKSSDLPSQYLYSPQRQIFHNTPYTHCSLPYDDSTLLENETISLISDTESDDENIHLTQPKIISTCNSPNARNYLSSQRMPPDNSYFIQKDSITRLNDMHALNLTTNHLNIGSTTQNLPKPLVKQRTFVKESPISQSGILLPSIDMDDESKIKSTQKIQMSSKNLQSKSNLTLNTVIKNDIIRKADLNEKTNFKDSFHSSKKSPSSPKNINRLSQLKKRGLSGFIPSLPNRGQLNNKLTNKCDTFATRRSSRAKNDVKQTQKKDDKQIIDINLPTMNGRPSIMRYTKTSKIARYKQDNREFI